MCNPRRLLFCLISLLLPFSALATIDFTTEPMAVLTDGAPPNMLVIIDDSGSMDDYDVFYAPGYDDDNNYRCNAGTPLAANDANTVIMHVSGRIEGGINYTGTPYFTYGSQTYGWGKSGNSNPAAGMDGSNAANTAENKCFNPKQDYKVKLYANERVENYEPVTVPANTHHCLFKLDAERALYVPANSTNSGSSNYYRCTWKNNNYYVSKHGRPAFSDIGGGYGSSGDGEYLCYSGNSLSTSEQFMRYKPNSTSKCQLRDGNSWDNYNDDSRHEFDLVQVVGFYLHANHNDSDNPERTVSGNFLNWYFSNTVAEWSDTTVAGGYTAYNTDGAAWTASAVLASNFNVSESGSSKNKNYIGYKLNVSHNKERLDVAQDVAKSLIRKLGNINIAISSFGSRYATGDHDSSNTGVMMHGFKTLSGDKNELDTTHPDYIDYQATKADRLTMIKAVDMISHKGWTPTSETMGKAARYFFTGWEDRNFDYYNAADAAAKMALPATDATPGRANTRSKLTTATIGGNSSSTSVFRLAADIGEATAIATETDSGGATSRSPVITEEMWCQKNAMAVLTDGSPTKDVHFGGSDKGGLLWSYDTEGSTNENNSSYSDSNNSNGALHGIIRVAGALHDHDFLTHGDFSRAQTNIESYFIAFGSTSVTSKQIFVDAGDAGGGGAPNHSFAANDGGAVVDAFKDIVKDLNAKAISVTAVAVSSVAELRASNFAFQATFNSEFWSSTIKAFEVNEDGMFVDASDNSKTSPVSNGITPAWAALDRINAQFLVGNQGNANKADTRRVYTHTGLGGVPFNHASTLSSAMEADLATLTVNTTSTRENLIDYLRGDVTHEEDSQFSGSNKEFRSRGEYTYNSGNTQITAVTNGGVLGDIVNSSPVYIAEPARPWDDLHYGTAARKYSQFIKTMAYRPPMVYVGANDGMMHAVSVADQAGALPDAGQEAFAYIPNLLSSTGEDGLHALALGKDDFKHQFFVDGTVTVSDVFVDFDGLSPQDPEWRTILIGGLRGGGRGLYALDVTCPLNGLPAGSTCADESGFPGPANQHILSEFAGDNDTGMSFSEPIIAKVNIPDPTGGTNGNGQGRWAAIVSNGYGSVNDTAALYVIFLDAFHRNSWTPGYDYLVLKPTVAQGNGTNNGLSSATAMDIDKDGIIDRIYAGDLLGNMWAFNIQAPATTTNVASRWLVKRLFVTAGATQPITTPPMVVRDPGILAPDPNLMVIFGTGKYMEKNDLTSTDLQAIYAVHDRGGDSEDLDASDLAARWFEEVNVTQTDGSVLPNRRVNGAGINWANQFGWRANLASQSSAVITPEQQLGERLVYRPFVAGKLFVFNSLTPTVDACSGGSNGWTMLIDWTSGLAPPFASYDTNGNGIGSSDEGFVGFLNEEAGSQLGRIGNNIIGTKGDSSEIIEAVFGSFVDGRRLGWEEKYRELSY